MKIGTRKMLVDLILKFTKVVICVQDFGESLETFQQSGATRCTNDLFKLLVLLSGIFLRAEARYDLALSFRRIFAKPSQNKGTVICHLLLDNLTQFRLPLFAQALYTFAFGVGRVHFAGSAWTTTLVRLWRSHDATFARLIN